MGLVELLIRLSSFRPELKSSETFKGTNLTDEESYGSSLIGRRESLRIILQSYLTLVGLPYLAQGCAIQKPNPESMVVLPEKSLTVNISDSHEKFYSLERTRKKGERDMLLLTQTSGLEENWLFAKYENGKEIFFENGIKERPDLVLIHPLPLLILYDKDKILELSYYHFHTLDKENGSAYRSETVSATDICGQIKVMTMIDKMLPFLLEKIDFRVIVSTGRYIIKFDKSFKKSWNEIDIQKLISEYGSKKYSSNTMEALCHMSDDKSFDYSQANKRNFAHLNNEWAKKYSTEMYSIEFTPARYI
jgi:hypothetical protein